MIEGLAAQLAECESAPGIGSGGAQHVEEERDGQVKAAARGEERPAAGQQSHRAEIDLFVAADRGRNRGAGLRERRRVQYDRVIALARALLRLQKLEGVCLDELDVGESVEGAVARGAAERLRRDVERDDVLRPCGEVNGE